MKLFGSQKVPAQLAWLTRISLFSQLSPVELRIVEGLLHERDYLAGEVIFDEGDEGQAIYIIQQGEVILSHQGAGDTGRIATLGPDTYFGDMALLDNLPRTAQARASQPSRMAAFFREDFLGLMDTHARIASKIAFQLAREMGRRLRQQVVGESHSWRQHQ